MCNCDCEKEKHVRWDEIAQAQRNADVSWILNIAPLFGPDEDIIIALALQLAETMVR